MSARVERALAKIEWHAEEARGDLVHHFTSYRESTAYRLETDPDRWETECEVCGPLDDQRSSSDAHVYLTKHVAENHADQGRREYMTDPAFRLSLLRDARDVLTQHHPHDDHQMNQVREVDRCAATGPNHCMSCFDEYPCTDARRVLDRYAPEQPEGSET